MSQKYRRFGLRSDQNLNDLQSPLTALGNILNDLDQGYVPEDLLVIDGIRNTQVRTNDIAELNGLVEEVSSGNNLVPIEPLITIKDRIDNLKVVTRDPPYLRGGQGPQAFLIPSSEILEKTEIDESTTGEELVDLTNPNVIGPTKFWDSGEFRLGIKIAPSFSNTFGGIQWQGYMSSRISSIGIETTGLYLIEEDPNNTGDWTRLGIKLETGYNQNIDSFSITPQTTGSLTPVRITMWWPEGTDLLLEKAFTFYENSNETNLLDYTDYYETDTDNQVPGELTYEYFKRYRASEIRQNSFSPFIVEDTLRGDYIPPQSRNEKASITLLDLTYESRGRIISETDTLSTVIDVGDHIVYLDQSSSITTEQITEIKGSQTIFYQYLQDDNTTKDIFNPSTDFQALVVRNLGLIGIYELNNASGNAQLLEINNSTTLDSIREGNLIVLTDLSERTTSNVVFEIRSIEADGSITVSELYSEDTDTLTQEDGIIAAVYSSQGLEDLSSKNQCQGTFGAEVIDSVSLAGDTTIKVSDTSKIVAGSTYIQYKSTDFTTYNSDVIPNDTLVTAVNGQTITIDKPLTGEVPVNATVVFIESEHYESGVAKEFCVLPLNTAPPFTGTNTGLKTTGSYPNIDVPQLSFENLSFDSLVTTEITDNLDTVNFTETASFTDRNGNTYDFLIK